MTDDEEVIYNIQQQIRPGTNVDAVFSKARTANDLCMIFDRLGISYDENQIRKMVAKQGIIGFFYSITSNA
ncbi:hypothetical protein TVAG_300720 [Trichomonas vaginalis G3]|uniref:Uncharacterized protein n=1 Tax=Trichomonas vaginalis (strain ATCC PRA-98 / G3) TaxID=412133 RepID=A2EP52_TRIV3|nr:hypothetical protein TVAGG3_0154930 [Trichomonas vaginalis G3]EAY05590.1 hypothetical protein TVAG_300720 [Trichomonas vaginalis G3]KAI5547506.1 hypothetical protein TVAGG3_0154930 [Trichomonas vaginalis G3]|eukprot:XP_001317813.1 hypothetical protein [Trichomonas vaginalis G3]